VPSAKFPTLLSLVEDGIANEKLSILRFQDLEHELECLRSVPVIFLIGQFNEFEMRHSIQLFPGDVIKIVEPQNLNGHRNRIASLFLQWKTFHISRGCILYGYSCSPYYIQPQHALYSLLFHTLLPMDISEFRKLVELFTSSGILPQRHCEHTNAKSFQTLSWRSQ
jgi:hypothetical protein